MAETSLQQATRGAAETTHGPDPQKPALSRPAGRVPRLSTSGLLCGPVSQTGEHPGRLKLRRCEEALTT